MCDHLSMEGRVRGPVVVPILLAVFTSAVGGAVFGRTSEAFATPSRRDPALAARPTGRATNSTLISATGLRIRLEVSPERVSPGGVVTFSVRVAARYAIGALGYRLNFGDGTSRANVIPLFCRAGPGVSALASWRFEHRYVKAGVYRVEVTGYVNCTSARAVARATVLVT